jgi:hypothetical protein
MSLIAAGMGASSACIFWRASAFLMPTTPLFSKLFTQSITVDDQPTICARFDASTVASDFNCPMYEPVHVSALRNICATVLA